MAQIGKDLQEAAAVLRRGGLVAIPTETVYGLAANALDPAAVVRIFEAKGRPHFDPLIVHLPSVTQVNTYALSFPPKARQLASTFWPGPLTLVMPKREIIPDIVSSGLATVGLRVPQHKLTQRLLSSLDFPLAAPSANPFGYISPTTAAHVQAQLGDKVDYILDGGACSVGLESTIVGFEGEEARILRLGGITLEEIEQCIGKVALNNESSSSPAAPGMLLSHYAPAKPLIFGEIPKLLAQSQGKKIAVLALQNLHGQPGIALSPKGDLSEAAQNLFAAMRTLDAMEGDVILAEPMPQRGLGMAINDRLGRAAYAQPDNLI